MSVPIRALPRAPDILLACVTVLAGCSELPESPLVDPDAIGNDMGTLISIADIRSAGQQMIESMNRSPAISELRRNPPLDVLVGTVRQYTTITNFDKQLFVNHLLASLQRADADGSYRLIQRDSVFAERQLRDEGVVSGGPSAALKGAEYVLSGEIRELFVRQELSRGGEEQKRTVQYALRLTRVADGTLVWSDAHEVVKQQVIGLVYR